MAPTEHAQTFSFWTGWLVNNATTLATALIVLIVGWYAAGLLARRARALLLRSNRVDVTILPLIVQVVRYGILAITLVIVLGQLGVQTASILAVLGAIGLAIALALQGTLSNIAAGVMLIWLRPFNVGEYIDAEGIAGTVVEIGLFGTQLRTYDGIYTFSPNSRLWNAKIINYSREKTRMIDNQVRVAYTADIGKARDILTKMTEDARVLKEPAASVFVSSLDTSCVVLGQRVWVQAKDWWATKIEFAERIKLAFDAEGIEIPYNKLDVHIEPGGGAVPAPIGTAPEAPKALS